MARLVLVGLPGAGKTTVAREVARQWDVECLDTDDAVAAAVGCSAAQYLRTMGEGAFREREYEALVEVLDQDAVVATGGGVVSSARARDLLAKERTFWLDCGDDEILARVGEDDRPLLGDEPRAALARLRAQRDAWYRAVSRDRIDSSGTLDDVVARVVEEAQGLER